MITKEFRELAKHAALRTAPANYSVETVDEAFRGELKKYCGSITDFLRNRYDLFDIIIENADDIVPRNVTNALDMFAEVVVVPQGQKKVFKTSKSASKMRAKKFLTQVGLAGVYEAFRLDSTSFEVKVNAVGGAAMIDFERMLDGEETLAEVMDVITEGLSDAVFNQVQKALRGLISSSDLPENNIVSDTAFDADKMFKLASIARAYGSNPVIFAPPEFVATMAPDLSEAALVSEKAIDSLYETGYISRFRGIPVVQIPQSFTDTTNSTTVIDPQMAYVLPSGGRNEKVVKVVLEGQTQMYDWVNKDNSMEIQVYRKMGVALLSGPNICVYRNTGITQTLEEL